MHVGGHRGTMHVIIMGALHHPLPNPWMRIQSPLYVHGVLMSSVVCLSSRHLYS